MSDATTRNSSTTAQAAQAADKSRAYTNRQGYSRMSPQATEANFSTLADTAVSAEVADRARMVTAYLEASAAAYAFKSNAIAAEEADLLALSTALRAGKSDPGEPHVTAHKLEAARLDRMAAGMADALSASWEDLCSAIAAKGSDMVTTLTTTADSHRLQLAEALDSASAAVTAIESAERAVHLIEHVISQGPDMRPPRIGATIGTRHLAEETYAGLTASDLLARLRIESVPTSQAPPEPAPRPADVFDAGDNVRAPSGRRSRILKGGTA